MSKKMPDFSIAIIDHDEVELLQYVTHLKQAGFSNLSFTSDMVNASNWLKQSGARVLFLRIRQAFEDKMMLEDILHDYPDLIVVIITSMAETNLIAECIKKGAYDFLALPVELEQMINITKHCIELVNLKKENAALKQLLQDESSVNGAVFHDIASNDSEMKALFNYCESIAPSKQPILITGETGVGKELFAKALHSLSKRKGKFIPVNIAGIDSNVFNDSLFGHVKGAYTGALTERPGLIEEAAGGTLFLDEIGELPAESQLKLLRLLQEHEYFPIGSDAPKVSHARIVVATNRNLEQQINNKLFRNDLYFRLRTHHIHIPPLRSRKEDISLLLNFFLNTIARELEKGVPAYPVELVTLLENYSFPGNVRELKAMVFDALSQHKSKMLSMKTFRKHIKHLADSKAVTGEGAENIFSAVEQLPDLKDANRLLIEEAMKRANNNQKIASQLIGLSQQTLSYRLKCLKL